MTAEEFYEKWEHCDWLPEHLMSEIKAMFMADLHSIEPISEVAIAEAVKAENEQCVADIKECMAKPENHYAHLALVALRDTAVDRGHGVGKATRENLTGG